MAREFGRIWISIWSDPDFLALKSQPQRLYMLLATQPGMSTCGVQSYAPNRWAKKAPDTTPRQIERDTATLETARFVVIDRDTDELLIRSHIRHDRTLRTANVAKSLARTWDQVASEEIRHVVLTELRRLHAEMGDNGWPGWMVPEIKELLARPSEPPSEWSFERSSAWPSQRPSEWSFEPTARGHAHGSCP